MIMWIIISVILAVLCLILLVRMQSMKQQLRNVREQIRKTLDFTYNKQISITLADQDIIELTAEVNHMLDYEKKLKFETEQRQNQLKQSISDIAHDLRTPITVVKGNLQLLEQKITPDSKEWEHLVVCQEKIDILQKMVDEFFELSLLESEDCEIPMERIDLTATSVEFMLQHEDMIRSYELEPDIQIPEKSVFIRANRDFLKRIFGNILNNVFKYAKNTFQIRLLEEDSMVRIYFENEVDNEIAIDTAHLFDRTYRADRARGGYSAGLGLYIVKLLMEKQGASVEAFLRERTLSIVLTFKPY